MINYEVETTHNLWGDKFWIEMMIVLPVIVWMTDDRIVTQTVPNEQKLQMKSFLAGLFNTLRVYSFV